MQLSRRSFLRGMGASVVAAAAVSLTACGGGGSNVPPSGEEPGTVVTTRRQITDKLSLISSSLGRSTSTKKNWLMLTFFLIFENKGEQDITLTLGNFQTDASVRELPEAAFQLRVKTTQVDAVTIPAGSSKILNVRYGIALNDAEATVLAGKANLTFTYSGKKIVFTVKIKETGTLVEKLYLSTGQVENA